MAYDQAKFNYAWYSTFLYGFDLMGWGEPNFSADTDAKLPFRQRPDPSNLGSLVVPPVIHASHLHYSATKTGRISIDNLAHSWATDPGLSFAGYALYLWRDPARNGVPMRNTASLEDAKRLADFALAEGISTIFYDNYGCGPAGGQCCCGAEEQTDTDLARILSYLHRRGLHVEALYTNIGFDQRGSVDARHIQRVVGYNNSAPAFARFDAIHLNIESGSFAGRVWPGKQMEPSKAIDLDLYSTAVTEAAAANLPVYVSIGHHWNTLVNYRHTTLPAYQHIMNIVAGVDVQTAADTALSITGRIADETCYGNSVNKPVRVTVETSPLNGGDTLTFYEEGELQMELELAVLYFVNAPCPDPLPRGYAFHYYEHSYGSPGPLFLYGPNGPMNLTWPILNNWAWRGGLWMP